jgi:predicted ATP-grasp superfamily ATP-dependent carboligase
MSDEKTVILKVDLDTSGLKKQAVEASKEVQKIREQTDKIKKENNQKIKKPLLLS